jgi:regulator of protease activity HflC (stomatin/prohibitin superfamily)
MSSATNLRIDMDIKIIKNYVLIGFFSLFTLIALVWIASAGGRIYDVWAQRKEGEAELARAESNRQIKTLEAKATEDSANHLAQAEIIRARGVAEANKIIGDSLKGNEAYLRYLWISNLECKDKEVIYIPTEANMPILEASRLK